MDAVINVAADGGSCWNPLNWAGCSADAIAGSAFNAMVNALGNGVINMLKFTSTFWMAVPSPTVNNSVDNSQGPGAAGHTVAYEMQHMLVPITAFIALISFALAIGRIAWGYQQGAEIRGLVRQVAVVAAGSLIVCVVTQTLINAGDVYSPWIIQQATKKPPSEAINTLAMASVFQGGAPGSVQGLWLFIFVLALLASIMQCIFMIVRGATLIVLMAFVPPIAAGSATEEGWSRFKRVGALLVGFALYKPVAATIYATGLMLLTTYGNGHSTTDDIKNALYGVTIIILAALALPAFIKFVMPAASAGASNAFSGAAAVGALAAGAAIVGLAGATGGASMAGGSTAGGAGARGATGSSTTPGSNSGSWVTAQSGGSPPHGAGGDGFGAQGSGTGGAQPSTGGSSGGSQGLQNLAQGAQGFANVGANITPQEDA